MEVGFYAGAHLWSDNNELGQPDGAAHTHSPENGLVFGIRAARRIIPLISGEGELALAPSKVRGHEDVDVVQIGWRAHALVHPWTLAGGAIEPFALFGAGGSTAASTDTEVLGNDTDFVVHAGLGARYQAALDWGLRLDARLLLPPSSASETVTAEWEILLGFSRRFGRPPPAPPADASGAATGATSSLTR